MMGRSELSGARKIRGRQVGAELTIVLHLYDLYHS